MASNEVRSYRELLLEKLGPRKYEQISKGFDLLGNIAVIDADRETARKIGKIIIDTHKNVETVLRKASAIRGKYRLRKYDLVLGRRNFVARYNENNCSFVFDVRKTFFSPRLAYERKRVVQACRDGEKVVVMFAGVGPFAIEIAKERKMARVLAIELNRDSYRYMVENIRINKVPNVVPLLGDADKRMRKYRGFASRIIMPLPADSYNFLGSAFYMASKKCSFHYYAFVDDDGEEEVERLRTFSKLHKRRFRLIGKRIVRPYSAKTSEMVFDFEIAR